MNDVNYLRMDLKVCEGCGTLWLRRLTADGVYCRNCTRRLADFPAPRSRHAGGRRTRLTRIAHHTAAAELAGGVR